MVGSVAAARLRARVGPWGILEWALAGCILAYVWRIQQFGILAFLRALQFVTLVSLVSLGGFLLTVGPSRLPLLMRDRVFRLALFILLWMVLSIPLSVFNSHSFYFVFVDHLKTFLLFTALAGTIHTFRQVKGMVVALIAGGVMYTGFVLWKGTPGGGGAGRMSGFMYYDANDVGMLLVGTLPLIVFMIRSRLASTTGRIAAIVAAALFLITFLGASSRGGFLGLIAVTLYMVWGLRTIPVRVRVSAVGVLAIGMAVFASDDFWTRMATLTNPSEDYNWVGGSSAGRMEVWKRGVGYMLSNPIFGVGADAFYTAEGTSELAQERLAMGMGMKWSAPHNSFVQIGAELGIPGLIAFLMLLWAAGKRARTLGLPEHVRRQLPTEMRELGEALSASILGYAATAFFLSMAYTPYLYVLLALVIGLCATARAAARDLSLHSTGPAATMQSSRGSRRSPPPWPAPPIVQAR